MINGDEDVREDPWCKKRNKIRNKDNEDIQDKLRVSPVQYKMRKVKLRWFGHVWRRGENVTVRRCDSLVVVS